ncbi:hypothetical protein GCM10027589_00640 [Actinocorallia lasiicapitis]
MKALIVGASGYNGTNVARHLARDGHSVRGLVRNLHRAPSGLDEVVQGDVITGAGLEQALDGVDVAFYFVHSLDPGVGSTDERDVKAATEFVRAARVTGLPRGVFFTTLAPPPGVAPPAYQRNRLAVEQILLGGIAGMTALRAGMVLGPGSRGIRPYLRLVQRTPFLPLGPWRRNRLAVLDHHATAQCLIAAGTRDELAGKSLDAPASAEPTHEELVHALIEALGLRRRFVGRIPLSSNTLDAALLAAITGESYGYSRTFVTVNKVDYIIDPERAAPFSEITPAPMHQALHDTVTGSSNATRDRAASA